MRLGIDFGTTNSAVAVLDGSGTPRMLQLARGQPTQRTVIYADPEGNVHFGSEAFTAYLDNDLQGRFLRSLKAFLPHDVPNTTLGRRSFSFVELVAAYLAFLMRRASDQLGQEVTSVVVGRPVQFHADPDRDDFALTQLQAAIEAVGLPNVTLQLEPVAAAHRYEHALTEDRTVLVGDFGGGTSDFAVLRVGPGRVGTDRTADVLGTSGVPKAGDVIDGRFMGAFVLPFLGRGAQFVPRGQRTPREWTPQLLDKLGKLYDLHRLRDPELERYLRYVETKMEDPAPARRLRRLVFDDLGYPMAHAIESSKRALADADEAVFRFDEFYSDELDIETEVSHPALRQACEAELQDYSDAIDRVLADSGLSATEVDEVFLTGGTSQIRFIRGLFADRFGASKMRSSDAFTTVCEGLALS
ncbi:MAG: Hsp70 family protein [Myxococcales bacterium]|nr:Hsp70 family protein [Myxococcales bacterium]